jgi:soluble lytic murein transglycosylase
VALTAGNSDFLNGYFADAVEQYKAVVVQGEAAPTDARVQAALGLGQAAVREGLFQDAVDTLTGFIDQFPADEHSARAHFLRGDAYLGLSRWDDAIGDFQAYLAQQPGLIDSYAYERIGDAQLGRGAQVEALTSYGMAAEATRTLASQLALRERVAQVRWLRGEYSEALAQYDAILEVAQGDAYRASIELMAARALLAAGETDRGMNRLRRVFELYPAQPQAYEALQELLAAGYDLDTMAQARVAFSYGDYDFTIRLLNDYTTQYQLAAVPAELYMLLGQSYRELGNPSAAVVAFQTVIEQKPQDLLFGQALLEQGRTRAQAGDLTGALEEYQRIVQYYGYLPEAAEALWQMGYLYGTNGQPSEARTAFEQLAQDYPNTYQARSGLFLAASAAMSAGDLSSAERLYGLLAVSATGDEQAAAYLSAALLAQQRGDPRFVTDALNRAIAASPDSYYAARARDIIAGQGVFAPPSATDFEVDQADVTAAEDWLREQFEILQTGALSGLSPELAADTRLQRGRELWLLAAHDEARVEFADLMAAYQNDGLASYQLAVFLRDLGAYSDSIVAAANILRAAGAGTMDAPVYIARMRYPVYYSDIVQQVASEHQLDPLLLFALIRHESLFDTWGSGAGGERGLTQLEPGTAEYVARTLNWPNFQPSDLTRPYVGISFGATYLAEQMQAFEGNVVAALAGYDAGPGRAWTWRDLSGGDPDLLMTAITEDSTRTYVQRVYSYYNIYRALYGESGASVAANP